MSSTTYFVITHEDKYQHTTSKDGDSNADGSTITEQNSWPRFKAILVGWGRSFLSVAWPTGVQLVFFFCFGFQQVIGRSGISIVGQLTEFVESSSLIHHGRYLDLYVCP